MPSMHIAFLGTYAVRIDDCAITRFPTDRERALLVYLALHANQPQRRETLATLLWPDHDNATARRSLRQSLSRLRSTLRDAVPGASDQLFTINTHSIQLNLLDAVSTVDVLSFRALMAACQTHAHVQIDACQVCAERLHLAATVYQGEFLAGFHLGGAPDFDDLVTSVREQLHEQIVWVLHHAVSGAIHQRRLDQALADVRRLLRLAPWREATHRQCMRVLVWMGDRNAALAQFEQCRRMLRDELGVDPEPATLALHTQILHDQLPALDLPPSRNPYQSLNAFSVRNADRFFGRERYTQLVLAAVQHQPFVLIVGPSGSGKSSLLHAGLVAHLAMPDSTTNVGVPRRSARVVRQFRPGTDPFHSLSAALAPNAPQHTQLADQLHAGHAFTTVSAPLLPAGTRHLMLVIDQFEELFTAGADPATTRRFLATLVAALHEHPAALRVTCVATLRADFVAHALTQPQLANVLQQSSIFLGPMTVDELARAIVEPARLEGVAFEPGLLERIVAAVADEPGSLPLLQFLLTLLWERQVEQRLTHAAYDALGGVTGALTSSCEALFHVLAPPQQDHAKHLFAQLVHTHDGTVDTRRLVRRSELAPTSWEVAYQFVDARLLVMSQNTNHEETVEIAHEALIHTWPRLREWLANDRAFRAWVGQLRVRMHEWEASAYDSDALLRGTALHVAEQWHAQRGADLNALLQDYIAASLAQQQQQHEAAQAQRRREQSHLLALRANIALSEHDTNLALRLALDATTMYPSPEAQVLLSRSSYAPGTRRRLRGHSAPVMQIALISTTPHTPPTHALSASADHTLILWDLIAGTCVQHFTEHQAVVYGVAVDATGTHAISCAENDELIVWNLATRAVEQRLHGHGCAIYCVALDAAGRVAISGGADGQVLVWNVERGVCCQRIAAHTGPVRCLALTVDGSKAITGGDDHAVRFWDVASGAALGIMPGDVLELGEIRDWQGHRAPVMSVAFSLDAQHAYSAASDRGIMQWNLVSGQRALTASASIGLVSMTPFVHDQSVLVGTLDSRLLWFDLARGALRKQLLGHRGRIQTIVIGPDGQQAVTGAADNDVRVWDLHNGAEIHCLRNTQTRFDALQVAVAPDGQQVLAGGYDGSLMLWDLRDGTVRRHWTGHDDMIWAGVHFLPDQRYALSGSGAVFGTAHDATLRLWNVTTGQEVRRFVGHTDRIWDMAITPDGQYALSGSHDGTLRRWDISTGDCCILLDVLPQNVMSLAVHPDGRTILVGPGRAAAANPDYALREIDCATGAERRRLLGHHEAVSAVAISPNGRYAASCAHDATILVWDLDSGCVVYHLIGHTGTAFDLLFTPDARFLLSASQDTTILLWDMSTGTAIRCYEGHTGIVTDLACAPDGHSFVSASEDGTVRHWRIDDTLESLLSWVHAHRIVQPHTDIPVL